MLFLVANGRTHSPMRQKKFLTSLSQKLENNGTAQQIIKDLNRVRSTLVSLENIGIHVTADFPVLLKNNIDVNANWKRFGFTGGLKR